MKTQPTRPTPAAHKPTPRTAAPTRRAPTAVAKTAPPASSPQPSQTRMVHDGPTAEALRQTMIPTGKVADNIDARLSRRHAIASRKKPA